MSGDNQGALYPPRARLAFRVGIIGHRPNRLGQADLAKLSGLLRDVFIEVKSAIDHLPPGQARFYSSEPPVLRAVSSLAEGADRLFAEQAVPLGFELCCPMPFAQAEFEKDFLPGAALEERSLERFRGLLEQAARGPGLNAFVLDGVRAAPEEAYAAAGRIVLNQSDLLVVVWDGGPSRGKGGTVDSLQEAMTYHVPVLWIDAAAPHDWCVLRSDKDLPCPGGPERCRPKKEAVSLAEAVRQVVVSTVEYPLESEALAEFRRRPSAESGLAYFSRKKPRWNLAAAWKLFRNLVGDNRIKGQSLRVGDFEEAVAPDWPVDRVESLIAHWINRRLRPHYAWSDKLADFYADCHRSAFVLSYPLAALAVFLALLPGVVGRGVPGGTFETVCVIGEFAAIAYIIGLFFWGRYRRWHDRWLDYRLLAELIRQLRFLIPLGSGRPFPRPPAYLETYSNPSRDWMFWHMRGIARAAGIPDAEITDDYLRPYLDYLAGVVRGQIAFHDRNALLSSRIERRLHAWSMVLMFATAGCILAHLLLPVGIPMGPGWKSLLIMACAVFPAFGAALAGINNQGEFARIGKRSGSMAEGLRLLYDDIQKLQREPAGSLTLAKTTDLAMRAAALMVDEVLDWRVVFLERPPKPA